MTFQHLFQWYPLLSMRYCTYVQYHICSVFHLCFISHLPHSLQTWWRPPGSSPPSLEVSRGWPVPDSGGCHVQCPTPWWLTWCGLWSGQSEVHGWCPHGRTCNDQWHLLEHPVDGVNIMYNIIINLQYRPTVHIWRDWLTLFRLFLWNLEALRGMGILL